MKVIIRRQPRHQYAARRNKVCLFVTSCRAQMGADRRKICLDTWLSKIDPRYYDWYFVVGDPDIPTEYAFDGKTMVCRAIDDWWNLLYKTQTFCRYAYKQGYDYVIKADDDTYVNTHHLKNRIEAVMRPNRFDVMAYMLPINGDQFGSHNWFPAGPLYVFSRKVMQLVAEEMPPCNTIQEDIYLGHFLCPRDDVRSLHDMWFSNHIPPEATTAGWETKRVGGHFKNMSLMYEVHRQLHG